MFVLQVIATLSYLISSIIRMHHTTVQTTKPTVYDTITLPNILKSFFNTGAVMTSYYKQTYHKYIVMIVYSKPSQSIVLICEIIRLAENIKCYSEPVLQ